MRVWLGYCGTMAVLQTTLEPHELLRVLQALELEHGRVRTVANGPRSLDLDIVDYEGVVLAEPELSIPHPLALERDFVVTPLLDLLPGYVLSDGSPVTRAAAAVGRVSGPA